METKKSKEAEEWDKFADMYIEMAVNSTLQTNISLYNSARAKDANAICEVGVGPGIGPFVFATTMMKKGAVFYNSDISEAMIKNFQKVFEESGITDSPKIRFEVIEQGTKVEKVENTDESVKHIFATVADNEDLPYPDEAFDWYLAHLSLMHVNDYDKMLKEAYRVTQKGAKIGISVMGRPGNFKLFALVPEALKTVTELPELKNAAINFWDTTVMKALLEEYGFKNPKMTYLTATMEMNWEEAFKFSTTHFRFKKIFDELDDDQKEKAKKAFFDLWEEKFGDESTERPTIEHLVVTVEK